MKPTARPALAFVPLDQFLAYSLVLVGWAALAAGYVVATRHEVDTLRRRIEVLESRTPPEVPPRALHDRGSQ